MSEKNIINLPTGEELITRQRNDEVKQYLLDARENYPEPYYLLEYNGVPFSTLGGIQAISGQKKNGKTFVLAQLMAAILTTDSARAEEYLDGLRVPERTRKYLNHDPSVLYVDTEMEKLNSAKVLRRVHWLCNWSMDVPNERFHVLWLRGVTDAKNDKGEVTERAYVKRYRLIRQAIEWLKPDAVFIDGIRDIIGDFNDNEESAQLVGELMALAEQHNICIWNTLHLNPRPGNDDESKMRGHLGTELGNKITDTLVSIKSKSSTGVRFTVRQQDARGKDMDDWTFRVTDDAGQIGIPQIIGANSSEVETDSEDNIRTWISRADILYEWPMTRTEVKKKIFRDIGGVKRGERQQADLILAINKGMLIECPEKRKGYNLLRMNDELPF